MAQCNLPLTNGNISLKALNAGACDHPLPSICCGFTVGKAEAAAVEPIR